MSIDPLKQERKREWDRQYINRKTALGQEIGLPPERENIGRYEKACHDFRVFCETYFRDRDDPESTFSLDWAECHLEVMQIIREVIDGSQQFALAMPRGSGKTALFIAAVLWAILTGRRKFCIVVAATAKKAFDILKRIKRFLLFNPLLIADFSKELHGIVKLEGEARRCGGQRIDGLPTGIEWLADRIVFPTCPGSVCSGAVLAVSGMEGAIEGFQHVTMSGGSTIRPDLVLCDDPQTRKSSRSPLQSANRIEVLNAGIAGLGGPKKGVAILLAGTIMRPNDLMDQILDKERYPEWNGRIFKAVHDFPDNMELWDRYYQIRASGYGLRTSGKDTESNPEARSLNPEALFYINHRAEMDAGARVYWPERFQVEKGEISGIQHFMNLFYKDRVVFWSEYQNAPQMEGAYIFRLADRKEVERKCLDVPEGVCQNTTRWVVASIDVQKYLMYFTVSAVSQDFTVRKIMHGTFPDQKQLFFSQDNPPVPLSRKGEDNDEKMYNAIVRIVNMLAERRWKTEAGRVLRTNIVTIDQGYKKGLVQRVQQSCPYPDFVIPYRGHGIMARHKPMSEYDASRNRSAAGKVGIIREMCYENTRNINGEPDILVGDVNFLKTFLHERLHVESGMSGCMAFCNGADVRVGTVGYNMFFIDHLYAEEPFEDIHLESGRRKTIWKNMERKQNHWLDCFAANLAAAELLGAQLGFKRASDTEPAVQASRARRPRGFKSVRS